MSVSILGLLLTSQAESLENKGWNGIPRYCFILLQEKGKKTQSGGLKNPKPLLLATCSLCHRGGIDTSQSQILCRSLEAQEKMDIVRVSVVNGFSCLPSSFWCGRKSHPQTVILRLLGLTSFTKSTSCFLQYAPFQKPDYLSGKRYYSLGCHCFLLPEEANLNRIMCKSCIH